MLFINHQVIIESSDERTLLVLKKIKMTRKQAKKVEMYALIVLFFGKFDTELSVLIPLKDQIAIFLLKEAGIKVLLDAQGYGSKGKTLSKAALRQMLIDEILPMTKKAYGWALTTGDVELQNTFGVVEADFKLSQEDLVVFVDKILQTMTDNVLALTPYNISLIKIGVAKSIEADYVAAKDIPTKTIILKKSVTKALKNAMRDTDKVLEICDNLLTGEFEKTAPDMTIEYVFTRIVHYGVSRHTTIRAHVYSDEEHTTPVVAAISIESLNRHETTDIHGEGDIVQFKQGDHTLHVVAVGFVDQDVPFSIKKGKQIDVDVVLVPNKIRGNIAHGGKPSAFVNVSVVGTNITTMTDAFGNYSLEEIPAGVGMLEYSNEGGNSGSVSFTMVMGQDLVIDIDF